MSADKRKQILIVFGGLAVVLVAVIFIVSPSFKSEDAIGAIGAVQKHRAPQIAQKDVILGDEQTKKQQQVLYGDFLADAAALQSINANMSTASRADSASRLAARSEDLRARYFSAARDQVNGMRAYLAKDSLEMKKLEALDSDLAAAASRVQAREDVGALNARLDAEFASLDAALRARDNDKLAEADVAGLAVRIEHRENIDGIRATMAQAAQNLDVRANAAAIRDREKYLSAMAKESAVLQGAEEALSTGSRNASAVQTDLGIEARDLAQRSLVNMRSTFTSESAAAEALGRMTESANAMTAAASRSNAPLGFRNEVNAFAQRIEARATEARSSFNNVMHNQLVGMSTYLDSAAKYDARTASAADFASYLGVLSNAAQSRDRLYASVLGNEDFVAQSKALYKQADQLQSISMKSRNQ